MENELSQRLAQLRKENHLSQEALAEKLSLSRQAVSKWERGESLPDTANLITLAGIYGVSLDELLGKSADAQAEQPGEDNEEIPEIVSEDIPEIVSEDIPEIISENMPDEVLPEVSADESDAAINKRSAKAKKAKKEKRVKAKKIKQPFLYPKARRVLLKIPVFIIVPVIYVLLGFYLKIWHPGWLILLLIPLYYLFCFAMSARSKKSLLLRMPVWLAAGLIYLAAGFLFGLWKSAWIVFLAVPLYYWIAAVTRKDR